MRIVLDAMGSDTHPDPEIKAAITATQLYNEEIILVGNQEVLNKHTADLSRKFPLIKIVHAPEVLEMTDKPARNARRKSQNSMAIGMDMLKSGEGEAFVTAGNTGGAMANALFRLGRIRGVKRPALTAIIPVMGGRSVVVDVGANTDCKPLYLLQFGAMGSALAQKFLGLSNPRVGLMSNGEEAGKGNKLVKDTYPLFKASDLNFIGNVESKELFGGQVDVVVTDGFTGNVLIKSSEAVAKFISDIMRQELTSNMITKIGALLAKPALGAIKETLDPSEIGAVPLLGVNGLVFIGHGRSNAHAMVNAIRAARQAVEKNLLDELKITIQESIAKDISKEKE